MNEKWDQADTVQQPGAQTLAPVAVSSRIEVMDILRGFALVGIVFMNIEWFGRSITELGTFDSTLTGLDHATGWLIRCFVEGKFYKLFTLLFGMGFAVMLLRAQEAGRPFRAWFVRRMLVLLVIGLLHVVLIWNGDILHDYAIGGLAFLLWILAFRTRRLERFNKPATFLKIAIVWLILPVFIASIAGLGYSVSTDGGGLKDEWATDMQVASTVEERLEEPPPETDSADDEESEEDIDESELTEEERVELRIEEKLERERERDEEAETEVSTLAQGGFLDGIAWRLPMLPKLLSQAVVFTVVLLIPMFLIGYWFIASGVLRNHARHRALFRGMAWIGMTSGLILSVGGLIILQHPASDISRTLTPVGGLMFHLSQFLMSAGYLGIIVLLSESQRTHKLLALLAPFGRMALTNYISQSLIMAAIFYGIGGGLYGEIARAPQVLIALAIIIVQVAWSHWWLRYFRFGPLEWVWRCATYKAMQPIRLAG